MRKSLLKLLGVVVALLLTTTVYAVGMGGINVTSALGQPLKAEIDLVSISKAEKDSLVARLASPDSYKSAGLDYPYGNNFKFEIKNREDGQSYISASSVQPVNDPFVSLLVELTWSAGKLSREYTFLLDPPGYVAEQPAKAQVQAVAPQVQQAAPPATAQPVAPAAPEGSAVTSAIQPAPVVAVTPAEQTSAKTAARPEEQTAPMESAVKPEEQAVPVEVETEQQPAPAPVAAEPKEWIEVQRGDTMYKIAARYKLADMNLDRMLVALYRVNANKFDGRNMNRIRAGKILQLPSEQEVASVSLPDAIREIHAQASDWNAYRQKLASAAPISNQPQDAQQVATGKISSSIADMAPVAKESAKEVLKLSKGEAPGDQVGPGGKPMSEQEKINAAQEEAIAKNLALKEQQERAAMLEKNMKDMQRLAQLKAEAAAMAQAPQPPQAPAATAAKPPVSVATTVKPAPAAKPIPKPAPNQPKPEPTLVDQILEEPLYLGGGAAVLLLLGGAGYMRHRRKKNFWIEDSGQSAEDIGEITGSMAAPVMPSPDTGDFTGTASAQRLPESDNVDPISEADLFLNFGRDVQAEEILKEALQSTPNNHQIHLKLLGIYAARKDANAFSTIARQLQGSGDDGAWQQAVAMGRKLDPDNPMYGGSFRTMEDTGSATVQTPAFKAATESENVPKAQPSALDFDFDVSASSAPEAPSPEQDFLDAAQRTSIMSADGSLVPQGAEMDFDITSSSPSMQSTEEETGRPADDGGLPFTLDFPEERPAEKPAAAAIPDIGLAGINLNFDDMAAPSESAPEASASGSTDDHWQEVATKLDLAKAYHEMGDASGAREILEEVLREGDTEQRETAQNLIVLLG
ncbi:MAG TPA: FimV/HubP family polar landmark protein [Gallionella sp.]|nr:FimV/HubP family polar landmark protein [Gallionella sp.]